MLLDSTTTWQANTRIGINWVACINGHRAPTTMSTPYVFVYILYLPVSISLNSAVWFLFLADLIHVATSPQLFFHFNFQLRRTTPLSLPPTFWSFLSLLSASFGVLPLLFYLQYSPHMLQSCHSRHFPTATSPSPLSTVRPEFPWTTATTSRPVVLAIMQSVF